MEPLSPVKQALVELRELRARLAAVEDARREPIAVVGMGLRTPGNANDPATLWALLRDGVDAISETPAERWDNATLFDPDPDAPGKVSTRFGGFLRDVDRFDANFFGLSRREAESVDPQHRLLLEVTWEALEQAGIAPDRLAGTDAGFFLGIANSDYWRALYANPDTIDVYAGMGGALSVAAGRLAYVLGTHGPTMCVDTACSSSLVSLHLACQSLRAGETSLAVAGGVSLILSPEGTINFSKARMLAPDGRCKTFDEAADGYVRSDGCAMLVLKRLSAARADGDRVLAVIRGSAVNQDGRSNGLTAPNGIAQESVIRQALANADLMPSDVHYVEAHGTGTSLGDPIELRALGAVYSEGRADGDALVVGSVKTNLGHLEAAAGVIGVAKVVLAMQHDRIPAHLHVASPTSLVDWDALRLRLPSVNGEAWPRGATPRVAAVSSFGFSGTNAHVILEDGELPPERSARPERPVHIIPLSARTPDALRALAGAYAAQLDDHVAEGTVALVDLAHTASTARAHLRWARHAIAAQDRDEAHVALRRLATGADAIAQPGLEARPRIAFLFTGQGAQYAGMGRALYDSAPVFRDQIDACSAVIERELDVAPPAILWGDRASELLADTLYAQPAIIAIELAMAALWRSWGIEPSMIAGHSLGEFAAAAFAGVLSVDDALRLVIARGRLVHEIPPDLGAMTVVSASRDDVAAVIGGFTAGGVELAADNGPAQVVLTGPVAALADAERALSARGIEVRRLVGVRHAFHSAQLEPVLPAFAALANAVPMQPSRMAWVSGFTGELMPAGVAPPPGYWAAQTRATVRFHEVAAELLRRGASTFIEVGPHPVLSSQLAEVAALDSARGASDSVRANAPVLLPSMRRLIADWAVLADSIALLYGSGVDLDWQAFQAPYAGERIALPTYPFERKRYWLPDGTIGARRDSGSAAAQRWQAMLRQSRVQAEQSPVGVDVSGYAEHWALLHRFSTAMIVDTLRICGLFTHVGERASVADAAQRGGIVVAQHRLLGRWLTRLVNEGMLRAEGEEFVSDQPLPQLEPSSLLPEVERRLAADAPLLTYVRHCAQLLHAVMTGRAAALDTLFPGGSFALAEALYTTASSAQYINALAAAAVAPVVDHPPERRVARVLEIGGGTGGTTAALVNRVAGSGTEYWFTDVSDTFLARAHERFGAQVTLRTAVFDADQTGAEQGIPHGAFDIVTSANALHATRNLTAAIGHVRDLLAPGGYLVLVESTSHHAWFDISTGLIEGWQHFDDALRTDVPLLGIAAWAEALRAGGFDDVVSFPAEDSVASAMGQRVIVARVQQSSPSASVEVALPPARGESAVPALVAAERSLPAETPDLQRIAPSERLPRLRTIIGDAVCSLLHRGPDEPVEHGARLMEEGIDSLMAVQLRGTLSRVLSVEPPLPATLIFEYPTIDAIAHHLSDRLFPHAIREPESASPLSASPSMAALDAQQVEALSDAEISALLEQRYGSTL